MRPIDGDVLETVIQNKINQCSDWKLNWTKIKDVIRSQPELEVFSIVHARWDMVPNYRMEGNVWYSGWRCTNCRKSTGHADPFCPHCGAKMIQTVAV